MPDKFKSKRELASMLVRNFNALNPYSREQVCELWKCFSRRECDEQDRYTVADTLVEFLAPDFHEHFSIIEGEGVARTVEDSVRAEKEPEARRAPPVR